MPELPEVEVIKLGLQKKIIGLKIKKIQIITPKSFKSGSSQASLIGNPNPIEGQKVLNIWRRAKILGIDLSSDTKLLFHLKMSGQLIWKGESGKGEGESLIGGHPTSDMEGKMPNPHTRVIFSFSNGSHLYFNDQRRFGWIKIVQSANFKVQSEEILGRLGPEPLDRSFTWELLKQNLLKHPKMPVKVAIMNQSVVAGVGNIYANEACFIAKIDPRRKIADLTDADFKDLYAGIIKALKAGIKHGGSTRAHFVDPEGRKGYFLDYAFVYGKDGRSCKLCGTKIKKVTLGGRGTYFCERCQS